MPYFEQRIVSGDFLEIKRYHLSNNQLKSYREPKTRHQNESLPKQKIHNQNTASQKLKRIMHANFLDNTDLFLTLTFKKKIDKKSAKKELKTLFKEIKKYRKEKGLDDFKYIYCMGLSKKDNYHFHMVINDMDINDLEKIIKKLNYSGRFKVERLDFDAETGLLGLAKYFVWNTVNRIEQEHKNAKILGIKEFNKLFAKKWVSSQNLVKPYVPKGYPKIVKSLKIDDAPKEFTTHLLLNSKKIYTDFGVVVKMELVKSKNKIFERS